MSKFGIAILKQVTENCLDKAANKVGEFLVYEAQKRVAKQSFDTGMLQDSIHYRVDKTATGRLVVIGSNIEYAPFVEFGTGIYGGTDPLYGGFASGPGRPDAWAWYDPSGKYTKDGEPGFVWTKGMKPRPYLYPAILENKNTIMRIVGKTVQEELKNV